MSPRASDDEAVRAIAREVVGDGRDERSIVNRIKCEEAVRLWIARHPAAPDARGGWPEGAPVELPPVPMYDMLGTRLQAIAHEVYVEYNPRLVGTDWMAAESYRRWAQEELSRVTPAPAAPVAMSEYPDAATSRRYLMDPWFHQMTNWIRFVGVKDHSWENIEAALRMARYLWSTDTHHSSRVNAGLAAPAAAPVGDTIFCDENGRCLSRGPIFRREFAVSQTVIQNGKEYVVVSDKPDGANRIVVLRASAPIAMSEADRERLERLDAMNSAYLEGDDYYFVRRLLTDAHAREADLRRRLDIAKDNTQAVLRMWENDDAVASQPRPQADDATGVK